MLKAQLKATKLVIAGMTGIEADKIARDVIEEAGYGQYFRHALGHGFKDGCVPLYKTSKELKEIV